MFQATTGALFSRFPGPDYKECIVFQITMSALWLTPVILGPGLVSAVTVRGHTDVPAVRDSLYMLTVKCAKVRFTGSCHVTASSDGIEIT